MEDKTNGARMVTAAMLGLDGETVLVGGHVYFIKPPTIKRLMGFGYYLSGFNGMDRIGDFFRDMKDIGEVCKALSWLIAGDESKAEELGDGTLDELVAAIEVGLSLIGTENFTRLSVFSRSVSKLIARPRP